MEPTRGARSRVPHVPALGDIETSAARLIASALSRRPSQEVPMAGFKRRIVGGTHLKRSWSKGYGP